MSSYLHLEASISVTTTSGRAIETVPCADLYIGSKPFTDREYEFSSIGNYPSTCTFIRGPNDDKNTDPTSIQTILEVPFNSTIYLDFWGGDSHVEKVSNWIGDWKETTMHIPTQFSGWGWGKGWEWGPGKVMKRNFESGTINLMGNNGDDHGTYYAFVCPQGKNSLTL